MLKIVRRIVACLCAAALMLLFLDFTGFLSLRLAWLGKIQFLPAIMAGSVATVAVLVIVTLLFGRLYCSTLCPIGFVLDLISWMASKRKKNRFGWRRARTVCRLGFLVIFLAAFVLGIGSIVALLEPYSAYGRIVSNLLGPLYRGGNNLLANWTAQDSCPAFYSVDLWMKGGQTLGIAVLTLIVLVVFAWRFGRLYCNTVCPVGTILGMISRYSFIKPRFDLEKCNGCGLCAKHCKASCINPETHFIDSSRCVACFDCLESCPQKAILYRLSSSEKAVSRSTPRSEEDNSDSTNATSSVIHLANRNSSIPVSTAAPIETSDRNRLNDSVGGMEWDATSNPIVRKTVRRGFLVSLILGALAKTGWAQDKPKKKKKIYDGGLAPLVPRVLPTRVVGPLPPGSFGVREFSRRCVACQLCVSVCPNQVLRPSHDWKTMMQPIMAFDRGYCRPECVKCSEVCPAGAIRPITTADKSATQIGYAVWVRDACIVIADEVSCGNCERHCPTKAIEMVSIDPDTPDSLKIPTIDVERCIGCGACEHLCPARPTSAIYVEGMDRQRMI